MTGRDVATALREISQLLQLKGENAFKVRAYDLAADAFEGLPQDHLETRVVFQPTAGAAITSSHTVKYKVPDSSSKPAFEMNGIKYYKVVPTSVEHVNDPVPVN